MDTQAQDEATIRGIIQGCEDAWNAGDAEAFGTSFADDVDYVVINGMYIKGRAGVNAGHAHLFNTVYKGSHLTATVEAIRFVRPDVAVARVHTLNQGQHGEIFGRSTWVLARDNGTWQIVAFQNTPITPEGRGGGGPPPPH
jgi:uncharacterized protein (TIGR02246 family)